MKLVKVNWSTVLHHPGLTKEQNELINKANEASRMVGGKELSKEDFYQELLKEKKAKED